MREAAVAIFLGERRTGGYSATVTAIRTESGRQVVEYRENTPAPGMMLTQALTSPWVVTVLPAPTPAVEVRKLPAVPAER